MARISPSASGCRAHGATTASKCGPADGHREAGLHPDSGGACGARPADRDEVGKDLRPRFLERVQAIPGAIDKVIIRRPSSESPCRYMHWRDPRNAALPTGPPASRVELSGFPITVLPAGSTDPFF